MNFNYRITYIYSGVTFTKKGSTVDQADAPTAAKNIEHAHRVIAPAPITVTGIELIARGIEDEGTYAWARSL